MMLLSLNAEALLMEELGRPGPASAAVWEAKHEMFREQRVDLEQGRLQSLVSDNGRLEKERRLATERANKRLTEGHRKTKTEVQTLMAAKRRWQSREQDTTVMKLPLLL
jgi:hypothetical protein